MSAGHAATSTEYFNRYGNLAMQRDDNGVLLVRMHTDDGPIVWNAATHRDFVDAFHDISRDRRTRAVVLTGTADEWMVRIDREGMSALGLPWVWNRVNLDGRKILSNLLDIEVPMVCAVNGPARVHSELALLCDIVICTPDTVFQDRHLEWGIVPGDGVHIVWPAVLGPSRGRHFLLMNQKLGAEEALRLGVVSEVHAREALLPRAMAIATQLAQLPALAARYSRVLFTQPYRRLLADDAGYGLALEGLSAAALTQGGVP